MTYYELPSIYGHDTFLLDVVAVGAAVKVGHVVWSQQGLVGEEFSLKKNARSMAHISFLCVRFFRATSRQIWRFTENASRLFLTKAAKHQFDVTVTSSNFQLINQPTFSSSPYILSASTWCNCLLSHANTLCIQRIFSWFSLVKANAQNISFLH